MTGLDALLGLLVGIELGVGGYYLGGYPGLALITMAVVACAAVSWLIRSRKALSKPSRKQSKPKS